MTEPETRIPFSERPLVKFLTLEYPMGPMQFIIMIIVSSVLLRLSLYVMLYLLGAAIILVPQDYAAGVGAFLTTTFMIVYAVVQLWVGFCFVCARLDDARIPRFAVIFPLAILAAFILMGLVAFGGPNSELIGSGIAIGLGILFLLFLLFAPSRLYSDMAPQDRARKIEQDRRKSAQ